MMDSTFRWVFSCQDDPEGRFCWSCAFWIYTDGIRTWRDHVRSNHIMGFTEPEAFSTPLLRIEYLTVREVLY